MGEPTLENVEGGLCSRRKGRFPGDPLFAKDDDECLLRAGLGQVLHVPSFCFLLCFPIHNLKNIFLWKIFNICEELRTKPA